MRRIVSAVLSLCLGTATVLLATPAFAAGNFGGSICGTVWQDLNGDGIRQADEPVMANVGIGLGISMGTGTDTNGNYCFTGLAAGTYTLQANDLAFFGTPMDWTRPGRDSHVDWTDGTSAPITIQVNPDGSATHIDHFDVGYLKATDDLIAGHIAIRQNGHRVHKTQFHVGDTLEILGAMRVTGNLPDDMAGTLTVPDGLTVLNTAGDLPSQVLTQHEVFGQTHGRLLPGPVQFIGATVRVDAPFTSGDVTLEADLAIFDLNPNNDVQTKQISATP
ncbi:MAG TPA: SdrD B-like domain-containing protein [Pseudonocardiaceae bacterium]